MLTASEIAKSVNGSLYGEKNLLIKGAFDLIPGKKSFISFSNDSLSIQVLNKSKSDLVVVSQKINHENVNKSILVVKNPKNSFFKIVKHFFYSDINKIEKGINKTAKISQDTILGSNVSIGNNVIIESKSTIESGVSIGANSYIGANSFIGENSVIHPNVTIYNDIKIGKNVIINSGSVLGAEGFGIIADNKKIIQVPHIGTVVIENDVIIGAGCTIDRATMNKTCIGEGTKIDGQVHIAHNVKIGRNCIIAGQSAIGGGSQLGNNVILGGQVGIIDNLVIGDNCRVAAKSAVMKSLDKNMIVSGIPAMDHRKKKRLDVLISKLPDLIKKK